MRVLLTAAFSAAARRLSLKSVVGVTPRTYRELLLLLLIFFLNFFIPSLVEIPRVKNIKLKLNMEWLTFGVIPIDEGASENNLIEMLD